MGSSELVIYLSAGSPPYCTQLLRVTRAEDVMFGTVRTRAWMLSSGIGSQCFVVLTNERAGFGHYEVGVEHLAQHIFGGIKDAERF